MKVYQLKTIKPTQFSDRVAPLGAVAPHLGPQVRDGGGTSGAAAACGDRLGSGGAGAASGAVGLLLLVPVGALLLMPVEA